MISIPGTPPSLVDPPPGCRFRERCPFADQRCAEETPMLVEAMPRHYAACHYVERAAEFRERARNPLTWREARAWLPASATSSA